MCVCIYIYIYIYQVTSIPDLLRDLRDRVPREHVEGWRGRADLVPVAASRCTHVCVYMYIYIYICIYIYIYMHMCIHVYMMCIYIYIYIHICYVLHMRIEQGIRRITVEAPPEPFIY